MARAWIASNERTEGGPTGGCEEGAHVAGQGRRRVRSERGAAALEFALILPLLAALLLGICESAYALYTEGVISGAAREASRNYALHQDPAAARAAAVNAAQSVGLLGSEVSIPVGACLHGVIGEPVTVTITHTYTGITGFFGASWNMTGKGTMRCNG